MTDPSVSTATAFICNAAKKKSNLWKVIMRLIFTLCTISHLKKGKDLQLLLSMLSVAVQTACFQQPSLQYSLHLLTHPTHSKVQSLGPMTKPNCLEDRLCASPQLNTELIN